MFERHDVQQTEEFSYLIFMKCVLNLFELGGEKGRKTHTKKDTQLKTLVEKLTLVIDLLWFHIRSITNDHKNTVGIDFGITMKFCEQMNPQVPNL